MFGAPRAGPDPALRLDVRTILPLLLLPALFACTFTGPGTETVVQVEGATGRGWFSFECPSGELAWTEADDWSHLAAAPRLAVGSLVVGVAVASPLVPASPAGQDSVRLLAPGRVTLLDLADDGAVRDVLVVSAETPTAMQVVQLEELHDAWSGDRTSRSTPLERLEVVLGRDRFWPHERYVEHVVLDTSLLAADGATLCGKRPWQATLTPPLWELTRSPDERGSLTLRLDRPGEALLEITLEGATLQFPVVVR